MRRHALAVAAAVLAAAGCSSSHSSPPTGSALLYWDFVRVAPAVAGGTLTYDGTFTGHAGNGPCTQSAIDAITIDAPGVAQMQVSCVFNGVQGVIVPALLAGTNSIRVRGWRQGVSVALYDGTFNVNIVANDNSPAPSYLDLPGVAAHLDLSADIAWGAGPTPYADCVAATPAYGGGYSSAPPNFALWIRDVVGARTTIDSATAACASALPAAVFAAPLDLDDYEVRVQALRVEDSAVVGDSCWVPFSHFAPGAFMATVLTNPLPSCP